VVTIAEGTIDEIRRGDKKHKGDIVMKDRDAATQKGVLDDRHLQES